MGSALNSLKLAKFSKAAGNALGTIGKVLERIGTISLWYTLLSNDMGPGEVTDKRMQESVTRTFIRVSDEITITKSNNK